MEQQALANRISGSVHIVGAGLLGTSIGLALTAKGTRVTLQDLSETALALAIDYGAGTRLGANDSHPDLVIVATPPDQAAETIKNALATFPNAIVTDVTSVKQNPLQELERQGINLTRYVGSHPMAGREKGGAIMARADLFVGRPWVICRDAETPAAALSLVEAVALEVGAVPTEWDPQEHDAAVAVVSHLPQVVASLTAGQLNHTKARYLDLAGGGLRDTIRIAASDPELWVQILLANKEAVAEHLERLGEDIANFAAALRNPEQAGSRAQIARLLAQGNEGLSRVPGKHGGANRFAGISVIVEDQPGQLAKLFTDLEELAVNMEDMRLEHSPGAEIGFIELSVLPEVHERAVAELTARGWRIV